MNIQGSKDKIQSLYDELKKEVYGTITPIGVYLPPSAYSYCKKAKALVDESINLLKIDDSLPIEPVLHAFNKKEVSYVNDYEGKGKSARKHQEELESLMRKATYQVYVDLCPYLTDK